MRCLDRLSSEPTLFPRPSTARCEGLTVVLKSRCYTRCYIRPENEVEGRSRFPETQPSTCGFRWWAMQDLNLRPLPRQGSDSDSSAPRLPLSPAGLPTPRLAADLQNSRISPICVGFRASLLDLCWIEKDRQRVPFTCPLPNNRRHHETFTFAASLCRGQQGRESDERGESIRTHMSEPGCLDL